MITTIWNDLLGCEVRYYGKKYRTRVIEYGTGEPLILLHGIGGHAEAYSRNIIRLGEHYRVMAIDMVWHGLSSKPEFVDDQISVYVDQLIDLMDSTGISRAHFEGESLGGRVAMWLAIRHPERVIKLILNTSGHVKFNEGTAEDRPDNGIKLLGERSLQAIQNPNEETIRKRLEWLMASPDRVTDELVNTRYLLYLREDTRKGLTYVFENAFIEGKLDESLIPEDEVRKVEIPTLVLWSDKNPGRSPEVGRRIAEAMPNSRFYCIKDAAHWPQWEKPEEHDEVVLSFLKEK